MQCEVVVSCDEKFIDICIGMTGLQTILECSNNLLCID